MDYEQFLEIVQNISPNDISFLENFKNEISGSNNLYEHGNNITAKILKQLNGDYLDVIKYIKNNFKEENIIITNEKTKIDLNQEKLLNSLEDTDNHIRVIFTVDKLTEGWDVLNLFEIVRMKESQNSGGKNKVVSPTTIQEKQLIGRGVRYFPFNYLDKEKNKRKFDNDIENELRMLEELFYYTYDEESRYISELKTELKKEGYIGISDKTQKRFSLKTKFKESKFYDEFRIIGNKREPNPEVRNKTLKEIIVNPFEVSLLKILKEEDRIFDKENSSIMEFQTNILTMRLKEIPKYIFFKALNRCVNKRKELFSFPNLNKKIGIKTMDNLLEDEYLGEFKVQLTSSYTNIENIKGEHLLKIIEDVLINIFEELEEKYSENKGTNFEPLYTIEELFGNDKLKIISNDRIEQSRELNNELSKKPWYVLNSFVGTSEEIACIKFLKDNLCSLEQKYEEVYLLRNEEVYKIYDFETGKGFQPDFLLFLKNKDKSTYYQIFIEPKGDGYLEKDSWKNDFLKEITRRYEGVNLFEKYSFESENINYTLIGLPLYNEKLSSEFKNEFEKI